MEKRLTNELFFEIHQDLPREGPGRDQYTRKAYKMLPTPEYPRILDIGCGPGNQTMELARLGGGEVVAVDNHRPYLDELQRKIEAAGLTERVHAVEASMSELDFEAASFDIIWAEGSIYIMGFEQGLTAWRRFLKPGGLVAVSEVSWLKPHPPKAINKFWQEAYPGIALIDECLKRIAGCGYEPLGHFALPEDAWWVEYYEPLQDRLATLRQKYADNETMQKLLAEEQREIDLYRKYNKSYGYVFYLMQKPGEADSA
jgi:ubiquinone/menaquinone biosynthesis C-methylase UbiE